MIKHYGFHKDYGFETPKQMVKALEDIGRLKFLEINKDFIVSANCVTNNKEVRYSERDELHIFHVSDYTTELVGRYNKKLDIYYVYRGDNTVIAVCEGYRITKSQLIF